ncbi:hypothetical protein BT69DRAFT_504026 [Atractiella rhizophila]|nr:hypothetical protein BT69DRAFT_504026 [Atractiella rhizophila]
MQQQQAYAPGFRGAHNVVPNAVVPVPSIPSIPPGRMSFSSTTSGHSTSSHGHSHHGHQQQYQPQLQHQHPHLQHQHQYPHPQIPIPQQRPVLHTQLPNVSYTDGAPTPSTFRRLRRSSEPISPTSLMSTRTASSSSHATSTNHGASGTGGVTPPKKWESHCSRNVELEISPPLSVVPIHPLSEISCKVRLGDKVALGNYERLEVCLMGVSTVSGEPPEHHTFLTLTKSILPRSADVKSEGRADREWSFTIQREERLFVPRPTSFLSPVVRA